MARPCMQDNAQYGAYTIGADAAARCEPGHVVAALDHGVVLTVKQPSYQVRLIRPMRTHGCAS